MHQPLTHLIFLAGLSQVTILIASALVPFRLNWRDELRGLSRLHRQMHWVYGGYVVVSIIAFAIAQHLQCKLNRKRQRPGPRILRLCCGVLGHSACFAGRLRYQRILEHLVGQSGLLRVDTAVQRFNDCLLMGRVAPG